MDVGKLFFSPEGRIGRQDFWLGWLALFAIVTLTGWIPLIGLVIWVVSIYCSVCIYSKRLHDMGKSGWLQLWAYIPYVVAMVITIFAFGGLIGTAIAAQGSISDIPEAIFAAGFVGGLIFAVLAWIIAFLIDLGFLLWVGIADRELFDNRFGPAPASPDYRDAMPIV